FEFSRTSTSTDSSASGWQRGTISEVLLAAWMPARRATARASPLASFPCARASKAVLPMARAPRATATRRGSRLPPTSTMRARPRASTWSTLWRSREPGRGRRGLRAGGAFSSDSLTSSGPLPHRLVLLERVDVVERAARRIQRLPLDLVEDLGPDLLGEAVQRKISFPDLAPCGRQCCAPPDSGQRLEASAAAGKQRRRRRLE